jgi:phage tail sheath protein FI
MATTQFRTPGVYIDEPNSFPASIIGVETAIPAFIGYTEKAQQGSELVPNIPIRLSSMTDYEEVFGRAYAELCSIATTPPTKTENLLGRLKIGGADHYVVEDGTARFYLYDCIRHFYANGGGDCYVVSCGYYLGTDGTIVNRLDPNLILAGLQAVEKEVGPTMLLVPDATLLDRDGYNSVVETMLDQCQRLGDRVALFDIQGSDDPAFNFDADGNAIDAFREAVAGKPDALQYGIAYFPFINTSVVQPADIGFANFDPSRLGGLATALTAELALIYPPGNPSNPRARKIHDQWIAAIATAQPDPGPSDPPLATGIYSYTQLMNGLVANLPVMSDILKMIAAGRNTLPPSPAMAGIYTNRDAQLGVWHAPANVEINQLVSPVIDVGSTDQEDMNAPPGGISINTIRTFRGRGTLVWGARTLDGNSNDWRYIQVRRTMIYVEQSIKLALNDFVFAPNDAGTWVTVVSMIESFLHGLWAEGGLMGVTAQQAFGVQAGLGSTMTSDDVLNGIMRVQVVLTMIHPAEFIALTFEQEMLSAT